MTRAEYNDNIQNWSGNVLRFAVWNCGDRMRGEDAMQEAFARLWEIKEQVPVTNGLGFLLTVVRRYLIDCFRHDAVVARVHEEMTKTAETVGYDNNTGMSDEMYEALGNSYKEIAKMMNLSDQQVQVYLFRARTNLKKKLQSTM